MKITIITINLNNSPGLEKTISSVISQNYQAVEFIIIDGASTDNSTDVIRKFEDKINYWESKKDSGIYHAMNKGIKKSTGDYLLFLNSGDYLLSNTIISDIFKDNVNEEIISGAVQTYSLNSKEKNHIFPGITSNDFTCNELLSISINHQATFFHKSLFEKYGYYNEDYKIISDWEFFIRSCVIGNAGYKYYDKVISVINIDGLSSDPKTYSDEKSKALSKLIPKRILADYEKEYIGMVQRIRSVSFLWLIFRLLNRIAKYFMKTNKQN